MKHPRSDRPLTVKQREGIAWLSLLESGKLLTSDIAEEAGVSQRTVQFRIKRARDWRDHRGYGPILLIMNGIVGYCRHGVKITAKGTVLCLDCMQTNRPDHPAFRKGRQEQVKPPPKSKLEIESPGKIVWELPASSMPAPSSEISTTRSLTPTTAQPKSSKRPKSAS